MASDEVKESEIQYWLDHGTQVPVDQFMIYTPADYDQLFVEREEPYVSRFTEIIISFENCDDYNRTEFGFSGECMNREDAIIEFLKYEPTIYARVKSLQLDMKNQENSFSEAISLLKVRLRPGYVGRYNLEL